MSQKNKDALRAALTPIVSREASNPLDGLTYTEGYPCTIGEVDFSTNTVVLKMTGKYAVSAGQYLLVPVSDQGTAQHTSTIVPPAPDSIEDASIETSEADARPWAPVVIESRLKFMNEAVAAHV